MGIGRLLLRGTIGALFFGHGMQKLAGWFGGHGPAGTGQFFDTMGLRPGRRQALAAGAAEAGGGLLLAAGLATPVAGALLSGVMFTAIERVHWRNGPWVTDNGFEYQAVLLASLFELVDRGPGALSADHALGIERKGLPWALAAIGAGAAGSAATVVPARRTLREEAPAEEATTREHEEVVAPAAATA